MRTCVVVVLAVSCWLGCGGADEIVDDCDPDPCLHGGTCTEVANGFTCACPAGFSGEACEIDVDDCASDPCGAGGTCTDGVDGFTCACEVGFWGEHCEVEADPLEVAPASLATAVEAVAYAVTLARTGGTSDAVWSLAPGGVNTTWLAIDPVTGVLGGTPSGDEIGPVSVTVHVEEPAVPENFAERTFAFEVVALPPPSYDTSFEGTCPDGWTLTGDWECGIPTNVGPASAFTGTQCLGTKVAGNYSDLQTWAGTTATSPDLALTAVVAETLTFRMWIDTEGSTYDGAQLQISTDGGANYALVDTVTPPYSLTIAGQPAWGGHQSALGWQLVETDLSAYAGQTVRLRFRFQSDSSGTFPGVYIDDVRIGR